MADIRNRVKELRTVRYGDLVPNPANWRGHPESQRKAYAGIVDSIGFAGAALARELDDGRLMLIDGHMRRETHPDAELPVLVTDLTEDEANTVLATYDPISAMAEADAAALDSLLRNVNSDNADVQAMLAALAESAGLYQDTPQAGEDAGAQIDRAEELRELWQTERGQLWVIPSKTARGEHRLLCGDSTNADDVGRVMAGERADALINDPPYGMRLDADFSDMKSNLKFASENKEFGGRRYDNVTGDHSDYDAAPVRALFSDVKEQFWFGADYYSSTLGDTMHEGAWLVWDKRLDESADLMFGSCFELVWSAQSHKRDILRIKWAGLFGIEQEPERKRFHPNHKPVNLYTEIITRYLKDAAIIADCYGGAGSNMVACEQLARQCRMLELEPKYVAVILQRMKDMGLEPRLA